MLKGDNTAFLCWFRGISSSQTLSFSGLLVVVRRSGKSPRFRMNFSLGRVLGTGARHTESTDVGKDAWVKKQLTPRLPAGYLGFTVLLTKPRNAKLVLIPSRRQAGVHWSRRLPLPTSVHSELSSFGAAGFLETPPPPILILPKLPGGVCKLCYPDPHVLLSNAQNLRARSKYEADRSGGRGSVSESGGYARTVRHQSW